MRVETIIDCQRCEESIRGQNMENPSMHWEPPSYCHNCGSPFPWTAARLQAAKDLADELDELDNEDREILKSSLDDISSDAPGTEVATVRIKRIMTKLSGTGAEMLRKVVVDVASEAVKKIFLGP